MQYEHKKINIAFFGSSEFSIPTLQYLIEDTEVNISALITLPPAQKNRGKKLSNNIVYDFAIQNNIPKENIMTPSKLRNNNEIISILQSYNIDFIVVVAYGKIIPQEIIKLPKYEILNLHPSALPAYRGAAPIERAIENGETQLDICIMKVNAGLDTGDVYVRLPYTINNSQSAKEIIPDIADKGGELMIATIKNIINGKIECHPQNSHGTTYANKIDKSELFIDLQNKNLDAEKTYNKIRAFNNCGCCYFLLNNTRIKILSCEIQRISNNIIGFNKSDGCLYLRNGIIKPLIIQKEGKKPVTLKDFLNGLK